MNPRRTSIAGALVLLFSYGPAPAAGASWPELLNQAERLSAQGKNEEAVKTAQAALADAEKDLAAQAPETGRVIARVSRVYVTAGAAAHYPEMEMRLSAIKSKDFEASFALGSLLRQEGKSAAAEDALKKGAALKPADPGVEDELAMVYDDEGRFEEEARLLGERLEKSPQDYSLISQLAQTYLRLGRPAQAKEIFARAKKIHGTAVAAYIEEGYFFLGSGEFVHAESDFKSALAVDTASPFGYHHMGSFLALSQQRYPEAEKYFRRALKKLEADPNTKAHDYFHTMNWLGDVVQAQGRYAEAEAIYRRTLAKPHSSGDHPMGTLRRLAGVYVSQGKNALAEATYMQAVAECRVRFGCRPALVVRALADLGQFYLSRGRRAEAEAAAARAEKACADVPLAQGLFELRNLAAFYASLGDASRREALYARLTPLLRAAPFDPDLVWVESGLADMDAAKGRLHEAEDHYRRAIELMEHNGYRKEEADLLDDLAALDEKEAPRAAAEAREKAKSLRTLLPPAAAKDARKAEASQQKTP
jgi:tetratricopeptide (TPR) repeat protein